MDIRGHIKSILITKYWKDLNIKIKNIMFVSNMINSKIKIKNINNNVCYNCFLNINVC